MLSKRALMLAKIETVYGTDPTPTPADNSVLIYDPEVKVYSDTIKREAVRATLSQISHLIGKKYVEIRFSTELKGSGSLGVAPEVSPLLKACGLNETLHSGVDVQYTPMSSGFDSCTIWIYLDGLVQKINGCRGSVKLSGEVGGQPRLQWTFQGLYSAPADASIPSNWSFNSTKGAAFQGATFTWGGYAAKISQLFLDLNNKLMQRESVSAAHGVGGIEIVGRTPGGSINPEAVTEATRSFWAQWESGNGATLQMIIGTTAGNIVQIDSTTAGCVKESISWGDRNGIRIYDIPFGLYSETGDNEIKFTFK